MQFKFPHRMRKKPHEAEDSIGLRVVTSCMALTGVLAVADVIQEDQIVLIGLSLIGIIVGSILSYRRRRANNFWLKVAISWGILIVASLFFKDLISRINANLADARVPLTHMLVALQALHCFDLPRRRDLNVSALVGLALIASASTLSRSNSFALFVAAFAIFGSLMLFFDSISRTRAAAPPERTSADKHSAARSMFSTCAAFIVGSAALFLIMPRAEFTILRHVSMAPHLNLPFIKDGVSNSQLLNEKHLRSDGGIQVNPRAYSGFAEELDLNYRGEYGDEIAMRVNSRTGELWRVMSFDTFDHGHWSMSSPKHTTDRVADWSNRINLGKLPSFFYRSPYSRERELIQTFFIESQQPNVIPAASIPVEAYFPAQLIRVDDYGSLRSLAELDQDFVYTVVSHVPLFDFGQIAKLDPPEARVDRFIQRKFANYLQIPEELRPLLTTRAQAMVKAPRNRYCEAEQICAFLQRSYKYDIDSSVPPSGIDPVAFFLENSKRGSCEHFASAFVLLCRARGIPTRLVTGYTPGQYNAFTGLWEVRVKDAHGWAECFIPNLGWVSFDPTPSGLAPGFSGYERQSPLDALVAALAPLFKSIATSPLVAQAGSILSWLGTNVLRPTVTLIWNGWTVLLSLGAVATVGAFAFQLARRKTTTNVPPAVDADHKRRQCVEFLNRVSTSLAQVQIDRMANETIREYAERADKAVTSLPISDETQAQSRERLSGNLRSFAAEYQLVRFSVHSFDVESLESRVAEIQKDAGLLATAKTAVDKPL